MTFHSGVHIEECLGQMDGISGGCCTGERLGQRDWINGSSCGGSAAYRSAFVNGEWDWRDEKVRSPSCWLVVWGSLFVGLKRR